MEDTLRSPMFKAVVPIVLGVVLAVHFGHVVMAGRSYVFMILLLSLLKFLGLDRSWRYGWLFGLMLYLSLLVAAFSWEQLLSVREKTEELIDSEIFKNERVVLMKISSEPEDKGNSLRAQAEVIKAVDQGLKEIYIWKPCLVYFRMNSLSPPIRSGDLVLAMTELQLIGPPSNPGEFDFSRYMATKRTHMRAFVSPGDWIIVGHRHDFLPELAEKSRKYILTRLSRAGIEGQELELLSSLVLGKKDGLEQELKDSFSAAGAMHVLCVSGLHVGIIFVVLNFILKHLGTGRAGRIIKFVLITSMIWFYALMTGLAPSVMRASLMFSLMQAGKLMRNPPPAVNSLATAALLLILLNPMVVCELGFQFSFLAVLAILHFTPLIQSWWQPAWPMLGKVWSLIAVSLAAQLGTAPIALHYFHQFPTWFLLTNLLVIPLATIIIYMVLIVIALPVSFLDNLPGKLLDMSVQLMEFSVRKVESMPYSVISQVQLPVFQVLLVYCLLIIILLLVHFRLKVYVFLVLILGCLSFIHFDLERYYHSRSREIVVYMVPGYSAMDIFYGDRCFEFLGREAIPSKSLEYSIAPNRLEHRVKDVISMGREDTAFLSNNLYLTGNFIYFEGTRILIAGSGIRTIPGSGPEVDIVLVNGEFEGDIASILEGFPGAKIIFDSSVPAWKLDSYIIECETEERLHYSVSLEGGFVQKTG